MFKMVRLYCLNVDATSILGTWKSPWYLQVPAENGPTGDVRPCGAAAGCQGGHLMATDSSPEWLNVVIGSLGKKSRNHACKHVIWHMNVTKMVKSLLVKEYIIEIHYTYKVFLCEFMKLHFKRKHPWNNSRRSQIVYFAHKKRLS